MYIYIYVCIYMYTYIHTYLYLYLHTCRLTCNLTIHEIWKYLILQTKFNALWLANVSTEHGPFILDLPTSIVIFPSYVGLPECNMHIHPIISKYIFMIFLFNPFSHLIIQYPFNRYHHYRMHLNKSYHSHSLSISIPSYSYILHYPSSTLP